jgi:hypothetical protein
MWGLVIAFLLIAGAGGFWLRRAIRSRGAEIPCTSGAVPIVPVLLGVVVIGAMAGGSGFLISQLHLFGAGPWAFTSWLLSMSAASIVIIVALTAAHTNRVALVWLSLHPPNELTLRTPDGTERVSLDKGCVRALIVGNGAAGPTHVQYFIEVGDRTLNLVVPFALGIGVADDAPWLAQYVGAVVQGRIKETHRFLEPFCTREP